MDNQKERDTLHSTNTKNLRFRTLNGKIKFGIHDLETKHESLLKLEEVARNADCLEADEEQILSEVADNLLLLKKKEARVQDQLQSDLRADKGGRDARREASEVDVGEDVGEDVERPRAVNQVLSEEEEMALVRFKGYEKRLVRLLG